MSDWLEAAVADGGVLEVTGRTPAGERARRCYALGEGDHEAWLDVHLAVAADFGTRVPRGRRPRRPATFAAPLKPVLTANLSPAMRDGYGDPAVLRVDGPGGPRWWLYVTSNDAPDAFPILSSDDLEAWRFEGFVFPEGAAPAWARTGEGVSDFWAPELHRVGERFWLVFAARDLQGSLAIGLAFADHPAGPFKAMDRPLVEGWVIDPHLVVGPDGGPLLVWKEDANHHWPAALARLLGREPSLTDRLFEAEADRRTARLCSRINPGPEAPPMEAFFRLQPLIEAAADDYRAFQARLAVAAGGLAPDSADLAHEALGAMTTRLMAQPLTPEGALTGAPAVVLQNDLDWEAHLIEGVWISEIGGRWWLFYAANDFSTDHYGVGAAVADHPLGPYRKLPEPLLRSTADWSGPGHPSVTVDAEGRPRMFLHGFFPGRTGYKVFRALLTVGLEPDGEGLRLV